MPNKKSGHSSTSSLTPCQECRAPTTNPRFCGRSCAAKYNNRNSPKRALEGKCKTCSAPIRSSRKYCEDCRRKRKEESEQTRQERKNEAERALHRPPVHITRQTVYSCLYHPLEQSTVIGTFLDAFESIAKLEPPYLHATDWQRHFEIIQILKEFSVTEFNRDAARHDVPIVGLPLDRLGNVLYRWVESITESQTSHPLAATFALDTARVLDAHAYGDLSNYFDGGGDDPIELVAMVAGKRPYEIYVDKQLKKTISQYTIGNMHVLAQLPADCRASFNDQEITITTYDICFRPLRCHQSWTREEEDSHNLTLQTEAFPWRRVRDFRFHGQFLVNCRNDVPDNRRDWWNFRPTFAEPNSTEGWLVTGYLPIPWITHCGYDTFQQEALMDVPEHWLSFECTDTDSDASQNE